MLLPIYQTARGHIPEDSNFHNDRLVNLMFASYSPVKLNIVSYVT
jgi:hypothetical protein